jgi:hypothetical protein
LTPLKIAPVHEKMHIAALFSGGRPIYASPHQSDQRGEPDE